MDPSTTFLTAEEAARRANSEQEESLRVHDWRMVEKVAESVLFELHRARPMGAGATQHAPYVFKLLRPSWEQRPEAVEVLRREALVGSTVSHPHLVPVLAANVKSPPYFVVTPWLAGTTLDRFCSRPLDLPEALWVTRQASEALEALDRQGWTHGDIKPTNIRVSREGHVTLLDLGFARRQDEAGSVIARCFVGTANYMAPEMITSTLQVDIRSDIYSLGVVLFELLTGRLPFEGGDLAELATLHRQAQPPDLRRLAPHLPASVVRLVREMLSKHPLRRPQTPQELTHRLMDLEISTFGERAC
jgi:serine/threonine protein kinase